MSNINIINEKFLILKSKTKFIIYFKKLIIKF